MWGLTRVRLLQNPHATPDDVRAALFALATPNILTDIGQSPNLFLFTNLTLVSSPGAAVPVTAAAKGSSVSIGLIVGIAVPVALLAGAHPPASPCAFGGGADTCTFAKGLAALLLVCCYRLCKLAVAAPLT